MPSLRMKGAPNTLMQAKSAYQLLLWQETEDRRYREMFQDHGKAFADLADPDALPDAPEAPQEARALPVKGLLQPAVLEAIVSCHQAVYAQVCNLEAEHVCSCISH